MKQGKRWAGEGRNSLWSTGTPEVRAKIRAGRKKYSADCHVVEMWFLGGCMPRFTVDQARTGPE